MSKYTMELREIVENSHWTDGTQTNIGLDKYPLYDFKNVDIKSMIDGAYNFRNKPITTYRDYLNNKIINHFYFREIGFETPMRFIFMLNRKMDEIMPLYNQRYASIDQEYNPLWNVDLTETFTHEVDDSGSSIGTTTGKLNVDTEVEENSDNKRIETLSQDSNNEQNINSANTSIRTPNLTTNTVDAHMNTAENGLTNDQIMSHEYLTTADHQFNSQTGTDTTNDSGTEVNKNVGTVKNDNEIKTTNENNITTTQENNSSSNTSMNNSNKRVETYTKKEEGSTAGFHAPIALKQWRENMLNVDMEIINELEPLFMQIW